MLINLLGTNMQKLKSLFIILPFVSTFSFATENVAEDVSGHRIGAGISNTEETLLNSDEHDLGNGIKLEYGYEFNKVLGINLSYAQNNNENIYFQGYSEKVNGTTYQIDSDIGYAFQFDGFSIKPYGILGFATYKEKYSGELNSMPFQYNSKDTSVVFGVGVRANFSKTIYADLRSQYLILDDSDLNQISLTIGYLF